MPSSIKSSFVMTPIVRRPDDEAEEEEEKELIKSINGLREKEGFSGDAKNTSE